MSRDTLEIQCLGDVHTAHWEPTVIISMLFPALPAHQERPLFIEEVTKSHNVSQVTRVTF